MNINYFHYVFFQGKFTNFSKAKVSIATNALQYGNAVFAGIRGYYNKEKNCLSIFRLYDHYKRFLSSLKIIGVNIKYSQKQLVNLTIDLANKNKPKEDVYFRPFAFASSTNLSPNLNEDKTFDFSLYMRPLREYLPVYAGISTIITSWIRVSDNSIPPRAKIAGAYINSSLAKKEAYDLGVDEAIFLSADGHVSEGSAANLFIVRDGVLITPLTTDNILEGITRKTIIQLASDLKIPVQERRVDRTELYIADESFFSGTGVQISWISQIDGRQIGNGKRGLITKKLQNLFFEIVRGNNERYSDWNTFIYY